MERLGKDPSDPRLVVWWGRDLQRLVANASAGMARSMIRSWKSGRSRSGSRAISRRYRFASRYPERTASRSNPMAVLASPAPLGRQSPEPPPPAKAESWA